LGRSPPLADKKGSNAKPSSSAFWQFNQYSLMSDIYMSDRLLINHTTSAGAKEIETELR